MTPSSRPKLPPAPNCCNCCMPSVSNCCTAWGTTAAASAEKLSTGCSEARLQGTKLVSEAQTTGAHLFISPTGVNCGGHLMNLAMIMNLVDMLPGCALYVGGNDS